MALKRPEHVLEVGEGVVEGHDVGAAAVHLERVATGAGAHVEDQVSGL
jgi:hypothetical protein